jgi:hypothetical protein
LIGVLFLCALALLIALAVVGANQGNDIKHLQGDYNVAPNVSFSSVVHSEREGNSLLNYGGSLFRGSGFWARKNPLPLPLTDFVAVGSGDFVYLTGGGNASGIAQSTVFRYDSLLHTYTPVAPLLAPRYRHGADILNGKIYVVGGWASNADSAPLKTMEIYDIASDTWTAGPNTLFFHGDTCVVAANDKIYLIGGYGENYDFPNATEMYDPVTDRWSRVADIPTPRGDLMCTALNGLVYAIGGYYDASGDFTANYFSFKNEVYDPVANKWTTKAPMLTSRGDAGIAVLDNARILVVGGEGHIRNDSNIKIPKHVNEVYYVADDVWVQKGMIPTARFRCGAANAGGLAFVFGGADLCPDGNLGCPAQDVVEVYLDVVHPRIYLYLKDQPEESVDIPLGTNQI